MDSKRFRKVGVNNFYLNFFFFGEKIAHARHMHKHAWMWRTISFLFLKLFKKFQLQYIYEMLFGECYMCNLIFPKYVSILIVFYFWVKFMTFNTATLWIQWTHCFYFFFFFFVTLWWYNMVMIFLKIQRKQHLNIWIDGWMNEWSF